MRYDKYIVSADTNEGHNTPGKIESINKERRTMKRPELVTKIRKCLNCNESFSSYGPQNRLCTICRAKENAAESLPVGIGIRRGGPCGS